MSMIKIPGWLRAFEIGFGIAIVILSVIVIFNPVRGFLSLIWILGILLLLIGLEMIVSHAFTPRRSRLAGIGLGIAVIVLAIIAVAFPLITSIIVISLFGVALLFTGVSKIIYGINDKHSRGWNRGFGAATGLLSVILAFMVLASPAFGIVFAGLLIGIALFVTGIHMILMGAPGRVNTKDLR